jgi:hypothetical protein
VKRLALALAAIALLAASHANPRKSPSAHLVQPRKPLRVVRAFVVSGTPQTATAFVAPGEAKYQTTFPGLLVVRVVGAPRQKQKRRVRFTCVTKGCTFGAADQPNKGRDVDHITTDGDYYSAQVNDGKAAIRVMIEANSPLGTYTVAAIPQEGYRERTVGVTFTLTSH